MATLKQCVTALNHIHKEATIEDNSSSSRYDVVIYAPVSMNWGQCHGHVVCWCHTGNKSEFWDDVLTEIKGLPKPEACNRESCDEWEGDRCGVM